MLAPFKGLYCWHEGGLAQNVDSNSELKKCWSGVRLIFGKKAEG